MKCIFIAALLFIALPAAADTTCSRNILGDWQCSGRLGEPLYEIRKGFLPNTWQVNPTPGSFQRPCEVRKTFTGDVVSRCW